MKKNFKRKVADTLMRNKASRDNDNLLIARILKETYGTSDMAVIAGITKEGVCETITRARRIIQKTNPFVAPSEKTSKARKRKQDKYREMKGDIL